MARNSAASRDESPISVAQTLGMAWRVVVGLALLGGGLFAYHQTERFLISDPRFRLQASPEPGADPPTMAIEGARFTPRRAILDTFSVDYGRSLYMIPLAERRDSLERLDWVRKASVARFWPDRLHLQIEERKPVAFIAASARDMSVRLVDEDGYVMPVPGRASINVPVIRGVHGAQKQQDRRDGVKRALRLSRQAAPFQSEFSEIDVTEAENLKVTMKAGGNAVTLWLGNARYAQRLRDFERSLSELQSRAPLARVFDLRVDGKILVIEEQHENARDEQ